MVCLSFYGMRRLRVRRIMRANWEIKGRSLCVRHGAEWVERRKLKGGGHGVDGRDEGIVIEVGWFLRFGVGDAGMRSWEINLLSVGFGMCFITLFSNIVL